MEKPGDAPENGTLSALARARRTEDDERRFFGGRIGGAHIKGEKLVGSEKIGKHRSLARGG
jgi:hypothetical protein